MLKELSYVNEILFFIIIFLMSKPHLHLLQQCFRIFMKDFLEDSEHLKGPFNSNNDDDDICS